MSGHDHSGGGHGHSHGFGAHALEPWREDSRRRLVVAPGINVVLLLAEAVGGIVTGSLAVLADAGHLLSDVGSIVLALIAARLAARPATGRRTFGYQRSEVLAALVNGLTLVAVSVIIGIAAIGRFSDPPAVEGGGVLALKRFAVVKAPPPRPGTSPAASAPTSTSRASSATPSPTRSARSA